MKKKIDVLILLSILFILFAFVFILGFLNTNQSTFSSVEIKKSIVSITYGFLSKEDNGTLLYKQGFGSGIIFTSVKGKMQIITNRHVIDCSYLIKEPCQSKLKESYVIRTYDNHYYNLTRIIYSPYDIDIAILEIDSSEVYPTVLLHKKTLKIDDPVIGIGYPSVYSTVLEYKMSSGKITDLREFLTKDGFAFSGIDSDIYSSQGSSGGGLFDNKGYLIGINTWIEEKKSVSINIDFLNDMSNFTSCEIGTYYSDMECRNYPKDIRSEI